MAQIDLIIPTGDGTAFFETRKITGKLNCIIVDSKESISFNIDSELGYEIYHSNGHLGAEYYVPRAIQEGQKRIHFDIDTYDKFKLNEKLLIRVDGPKNTEVKMIIRLD